MNSLLVPALAHGGYDALLVRSQFVDERLIAGLFVPGGPEHHFGQDRGEIDTFRCERVGELPSIRCIRLRGDDAMRFQLAQPIGQDVRRDALVRFQEFFVGLKSS